MVFGGVHFEQLYLQQGWRMQYATRIIKITLINRAFYWIVRLSNASN